MDLVTCLLLCGAVVGLCVAFQESSTASEKQYDHPPHASYARPLIVWSLQAPLTAYIMTIAADYATEVGNSATSFADPEFAHNVGVFMLSYVLFLFISRIFFCGPRCIYEFLWCCNEGMLITALGCLTDRPMLVGMAVTSVAMDQFCWWIELILYAVLRKHVIGVMKFLSHPQTQLIQKITTFHHWWFIPLNTYVLQGQFPKHTFLVSCLFTSLSTLLCAFTCPKHVLIPHINDSGDAKAHKHKVYDIKEKKFEAYYLNVNSGYEFWPDIPIKFLHWANDKHFVIYYTHLVISGNLLLNAPPTFLLYQLCEQVF